MAPLWRGGERERAYLLVCEKDKGEVVGERERLRPTKCIYMYQHIH